MRTLAGVRDDLKRINDLITNLLAVEDASFGVELSLIGPRQMRDDLEEELIAMLQERGVPVAPPPTTPPREMRDLPGNPVASVSGEE